MRSQWKSTKEPSLVLSWKFMKPQVDTRSSGEASDVVLTEVGGF